MLLLELISLCIVLKFNEYMIISVNCSLMHTVLIFSSMAHGILILDGNSEDIVHLKSLFGKSLVGEKNPICVYS